MTRQAPARIVEAKAPAAPAKPKAEPPPKAKTTDDVYSVVNEVKTILNTLESAGVLGAPQAAAQTAKPAAPAGVDVSQIALIGGAVIAAYYFLK